MVPTSGLRIGDADREAAATALREHFAQGRLTMEEFQHRLELVFAAKTEGDLGAINGDLPGPGSSLPWPATGASGSYNDGFRGRSAESGPPRRPGIAAFAGFVVVILALILIAFILPVAFIGTVISRSLLFVLMALLFGRRGLLRRFRRWIPRSLRRWLF
jgi:uncharacterized membrane protein